MKKVIKLMLAFLCLSNLSSFAQISGKVFIDINNDEQFNEGEKLCTGVIVNAYLDNTLKIVSTTKTLNIIGQEGTYNLQKLKKNKKYRIEFVFPQEYATPEYGIGSLFVPTIFAFSGNTSANFGLKIKNNNLQKK